MNSIDLSPFYRNSIGFDKLASLIDNAMNTESVGTGYPPYNIEVIAENQYTITLAVAGFVQSEIDITVEKGVLTVRGARQKEEERQYLHQGIANRRFERKFNLADHVEVTNATLENGLLTLALVKEIPEAMKPRKISINQAANPLEHTDSKGKEASDNIAA